MTSGWFDEGSLDNNTNIKEVEAFNVEMFKEGKSCVHPLYSNTDADDFNVNYVRAQSAYLLYIICRNYKTNI